MRAPRINQIAPDQEENGGIYHVVSRIIWRDFALHDEECEMFRSMMRKLAAYCGVEVQAYCVMSNHFHLLVRVPPRPEEFEAKMEDEAFFEHLALAYNESKVTEIRKSVKKNRRVKGGWRTVRKIKAEHLRRMFSLSEFLKALKQQFTLWFNKKHGKSGTLWEGRFKSVLVQGGRAAQMTAAYIDLNPVRAGIVKDLSTYPWCSYAEAMGNDVYTAEAQAGILSLMNRRAHEDVEFVDEEMTTQQALENYRIILAEEVMAVDHQETIADDDASPTQQRKQGFRREEVEEILANGGKLGSAELLRCRVRYFTDGGVLGTRSYVDKVFAMMKAKDAAKSGKRFAKRKTGARKWKALDGEEMFSLRNLRKDVIS